MGGKGRVIASISVLIIGIIPILLILPYDAPTMDSPDWIAEGGDDNLLVVESYGTITLWDIERKQDIISKEYNSTIYEIETHNDTLAIGLKDGRLILLNVNTFEELQTIKHNSAVTTLSWSNNNFLAVGLENGDVYVYKDGNEIDHFHYEDNWVNSVSLSLDGHFLAIAYYKDGLRVINISQPNNLLISTDTTAIDCAFSPNYTLAVSYGSGDLHVYDSNLLNITFSYSNFKGITYLDWSDDGNILFARGTNIILRAWDMLSGNLLVDNTQNGRDASHLIQNNQKIYVVSRSAVVIYDFEGNFIDYFPELLEAPLFLPIFLIILIALLCINIYTYILYQKEIKEPKVIFIEKKISPDLIVTLVMTGMWLMIAFFIYMELRSNDLDFIKYSIMMVLGIFGSFIFIQLITLQRQIIITNDKIILPTSYFHEKFRGKKRIILPKDVRTIHTYYFYNMNEKDIQKRGFDIITMDGVHTSMILQYNPQGDTHDKVLDAFQQLFESRWPLIYEEKPYIDYIKWEKIKKFANQSRQKATLKFIASVSLPFTLLLSIFIFDIISIISVQLYLIITLSLIICFTFVVIVSTLNFQKFVEAKGIQVLLQTYYGYYPESQVTDIMKKEYIKSDEIDRITYDQWKEKESQLKNEKRVFYSTLILAIIGLSCIIIGLSFEYFLLSLIGFIVIISIYVLAMRLVQYQHISTLINKAIEYELLTGEIILPDDFEIPSFMSQRFIPRQPIEFTIEEKKMAEELMDKDDVDTLKIMIIMTMFLIFGIAFMIFNPLEINSPWDLPVFILILLVPIFSVVLISSRKYKVLWRYKMEKKRQELVKERENRQNKRY